VPESAGGVAVGSVVVVVSVAGGWAGTASTGGATAAVVVWATGEGAVAGGVAFARACSTDH
jgi:hypothetical protein